MTSKKLIRGGNSYETPSFDVTDIVSEGVFCNSLIIKDWNEEEGDDELWFN